MKRRVETAVRIVVLFVAFFTSSIASAQEIVVDYALEIVPSGVPYPSGEVGYALVVTANWSTNDQEPFTVELTVPPGLELTGTQCDGYEGIVSFDAATRVVTWSDRLDNPYIAFNSCRAERSAAGEQRHGAQAEHAPPPVGAALGLLQ